MKISVLLEDETEKRAHYVTDPAGNFIHLAIEGNVYATDKELKKAFNYSTLVSSNADARSQLQKNGFKIRNTARKREIFHIKIPSKTIRELDNICRNEYPNFSRSDLINNIIIDNKCLLPPVYEYERGMVETSLTMHPSASFVIDGYHKDTGRSSKHLVYDFIIDYLERRNYGEKQQKKEQ